MSLERIESRLASAVEVALGAGMLGVFLTLVVLVGMRYLFRSGLVGANELSTVAFIYLSSLGAAVAISRKEHIRVDLLSRHLGPGGERALEVVSLGLIGVLNAVVLACSLPWIAHTGHVPMPAAQIPRYVAQVSIPLGCSLAVLFCAARIAVLTRREPGP